MEWTLFLFKLCLVLALVALAFIAYLFFTNSIGIILMMVLLSPIALALWIMNKLQI